MSYDQRQRYPGVFHVDGHQDPECPPVPPPLSSNRSTPAPPTRAPTAGLRSEPRRAPPSPAWPPHRLLPLRHRLVGTGLPPDTLLDRPRSTSRGSLPSGPPPPLSPSWVRRTQGRAPPAPSCPPPAALRPRGPPRPARQLQP
jgi:hypothetical protein